VTNVELAWGCPHLVYQQKQSHHESHIDFSFPGHLFRKSTLGGFGLVCLGRHGVRQHVASPRPRLVRISTVRFLSAVRNSVSVQRRDAALLFGQSAGLLRYPSLPSLRDQPIRHSASGDCSGGLPGATGRPIASVFRPGGQPVHLSLRFGVTLLLRRLERRDRFERFGKRSNFPGCESLQPRQGSNQSLRGDGSSASSGQFCRFPKVGWVAAASAETRQLGGRKHFATSPNAGCSSPTLSSTQPTREPQNWLACSGSFPSRISMRIDCQR